VLQCWVLAPLRGAGIVASGSGGIVAGLLNPRLLSGKPSACGRRIWHPFGMGGLLRRDPGVSSRTPQPPATVWQAFSLRAQDLASLRDAGIVGLGFRGCRRGAPQPPATIWHPFGMRAGAAAGAPHTAALRWEIENYCHRERHTRHDCGDSTIALYLWTNRARLPSLMPHSMQSCGGNWNREETNQTVTDTAGDENAGGVPESSRGLRSNATIPPDMWPDVSGTLKGCENGLEMLRREEVLASLRDAGIVGFGFRGYRRGLLNPRLLSGKPSACGAEVLASLRDALEFGHFGEPCPG